MTGRARIQEEEAAPMVGKEAAGAEG